MNIKYYVSYNENDLNTLREMSPISQLSQSTDRTNTPPSIKDIQRDEPMLGFESIQ